MKTRTMIPSLALMVIAVLSIGFFSACDSENSCTEPEVTEEFYVMTVGRIDAQPEIALGDTLWVTFAEIVVTGCKSFERIVTEVNYDSRTFTLIGKD